MMRRWFLPLLSAVFFLQFHAPAWAIKGFSDQFVDTYAENSSDAEFKELVEKAKCNICHVQGENKKVRNPYGDAAAKLLDKKDFPAKRFKEEPEKCKEEIEAAFRKLEEMKAPDGETFGEKIKAGLLPGGDTDGK
jgi:hypothetical protein